MRAGKTSRTKGAVMNELQKIFCDGASSAYKDCADKIEDMIAKSPEDVKQYISYFQPMADACRVKAKNVYDLSDEFEKATRQ